MERILAGQVAVVPGGALEAVQAPNSFGDTEEEDAEMDDGMHLLPLVPPMGQALQLLGNDLASDKGRARQ